MSPKLVTRTTVKITTDPDPLPAKVPDPEVLVSSERTGRKMLKSIVNTIKSISRFILFLLKGEPLP